MRRVTAACTQFNLDFAPTKGPLCALRVNSRGLSYAGAGSSVNDFACAFLVVRFLLIFRTEFGLPEVNQTLLSAPVEPERNAVFFADGVTCPRYVEGLVCADSKWNGSC